MATLCQILPGAQRRTPAHPVSHSSRFCGRGTTRPRWATCRSSQPVVAGVEASPGPIVSRRTHHRGPTRRWRSPARLLGRLAGQPQDVLPGPRTPPSAPSPRVRSLLGSAMLSRKDTPPHRGRAPPLPSTKRRRCRTTDLRPPLSGRHGCARAESVFRLPRPCPAPSAAVRAGDAACTLAGARSSAACQQRP